MKNIKKIILYISILILIVILGQNILYAATYNEKDGIETIVSSDPNTVVGNTISLSHKQLVSTNNTYCVAYGKHLTNANRTYSIKNYVKIDGNVATGLNGESSTNEYNAILAAILSGDLKQGYGDLEKYNEAQQALYKFWDDWIDSVGKPTFGLDKWSNRSYNNNFGTNQKFPNANQYLQQAKNYAASGAECKVGIYFLIDGDPENYQELIITVPEKTPPPPPPPPPPGQDTKKGEVVISGTVWEDTITGKGNDNNNILGQEDKGIAGVKVFWKDNSGNIISSTTTDANGFYTMTQYIDMKDHEYSRDENKYNQLNSSYIEFEYNGLKYTTVANSLSGDNTSKGTEVLSSRNDLNNKFDEITKQGVMDNGQVAYRLSYTQGEHNSILNQSISDFPVSANTKLTGISNLLDKYAETTSRNFCHSHCYVSQYNPPVHGHQEIDKDGNIININCNGNHCINPSSTTYPEIDGWKISNMNLGLVLREQPDIALTSDIKEVKVIMNGQQYTYEYNNRGIQNNEELFDYKVKFGNKYANTYKRPVNPSDIAYVNQNDPKKLEVYVKYNIIVKNQSNTLNVNVGEIVNYYDDDYTIVSSGWNPSSKYGDTYNGNGYKAAYTTQLSGEIIEPGKTSRLLEIEFKVNDETIKGLIKDEAPLKNVSEINIYKSLYGANTVCAENKLAGEKGIGNTQYAGIDIDSTPGNAQPNDLNSFEDDTDQAPTFLLYKDPNYKVVSGTVWEDTNISTNNERLGNGIKDGNEKGVANVKVELLKVNDNGTIEPAKRYLINNNTPQTQDAITYTDSNGNYSFEGVVTDNYIIKYTYGDDINGGYSSINGHGISARNYKSTIITTDPVKGVIKGTDNDKWHLTTQDNASIAVDDLQERLNNPSLINSNFNQKLNMTAYSMPFKIQVEYTKEQQAQVGEDGGSFEHDLGIFDFGIIERPRENIVIDKTISNLKITLANGQVLIDGNPYTDKLSYVKALGNTITNRDVKPINKLISIEIDTELIHGAKIDITYAITVTNNSEQDYDYAVGNSYYYFGERGSLPLITKTVEEVVDYVDDELTVSTDGENGDWKKQDWKYLLDAGYISEETYNNIDNKNYTILTTTGFENLTTEAGKNSKTINMHVSKLLANQEDEFTYENHTEIIKLGGKIARTIKEVDNNTREQVEKQYQPGNYEPTPKDRTHQVDDDRIIVRITPPTGLLDNIIIYVTIILIAGAVIATGTYFIKKKVL